MPTIRTPAILLCCIALTGCNAFTKVKNYCSEEPVVCSVAAAAIVASIALTVAASSGGGKDGGRRRSTAGGRGGLESVNWVTSESTYPYTSTEQQLVARNPLEVISDARLKQDIRPTRKLENGIQLYTFRYWNDARTFEGVMAQDLLQDERYKHAVHVSPKGYYVVDLRALGLEMTGDARQFAEAGRKALEAARPAG